MAYLRTQFGAMHPRATPVETEARCLLAFSMLIGDHLITARHPRMKRADVMAAAGKLLESE